MVEEKYFKLTSALYKVIEFFPEEEPLRKRTKEKALEIMENLVLFSLPQGNPNPGVIQKEKISTQILKDIEVLKGYLKLGKSQGWIDSLNFLILSKEYDKVKEEIQPAFSIIQRNTPLIKNDTKQMIVPQKSISDRQEKILNILDSQGQAQVADLKKILPHISKRTIRRDLDDLLKKKRVNRMGEWNQVSYVLV